MERPQVGDIVQVKEEHWPTVGLHFGLVTRLIEWPSVATCEACVIFLDPNLINPIQLQTQHLEVISRA